MGEITQDKYVSLKYHIGTAPSIPVASVLVLEHHYPTMSKIWGHGCSSKEER